MSSHIGAWVLRRAYYVEGPEGSGGSSGVAGPAGAVAVFNADMTFTISDLEGDDEHGAWLADGTDIVTESEGRVGLWKLSADGQDFHRELSDEQTGYRGPAYWHYIRDPALYEKRCLRHLQQIPGVGPKLAAKMWMAGARLPRDVAAWASNAIVAKAALLGIDEQKMTVLCREAERL